MQHVAIEGLEPKEQAAVDAVITTLTRVEPGNRNRQLYMDAKMVVRPLGWTQQQYASVRTVLGWPSKAVRALASICRNEGIVSQDGQDYGLGDWWYDNNLRVECSQAQDLSLIYGPAFIVTTRGDTQAGEPEILTTIKPPTLGSGAWNGRTRRLDYFVSINDTHEQTKTPTDLAIYLPNLTITATKTGSTWEVTRQEHPLPFVPVAPLVYQARHDRPFGTARISLPVISLTDNAIRTVMRAEAGAEAYINPQRWIMGADMSQFTDSNGIVNPGAVWRAILGEAVAIGPNENTDSGNPIVPTVGQFPQLDMQPHLSQIEAYASMFAAETDIPVASLGVSHTQRPASAEAIQAQKDDLIDLADKTMLEWSGAWEQVAMTSLMLREGMSERPSGVRFRTKWRDPHTLNLAATADAVQKLTSGDRPIIPPESDIALEQLGLSDSEIQRVQMDRKRLAGVASLQALAASLTAKTPTPGKLTPDEATALVQGASASAASAGTPGNQTSFSGQ